MHMTPDEVKTRLKAKSITQAQLARACHVSSAAMALFINRKMTSARLEKRLARALEITIEELRADDTQTAELEERRE
jgi:transcriptional regulator with XRE-family HTH domain